MSKTPDNSSGIEAHKITKPIQLLAAWLIGLTVVNASFLGTALMLGESSWLRDFLVIAAVLNVPIFLAAIFLLQTRFRPEMQEDTYYSKYLESQITNKQEIAGGELISLRAELYTANTRTLEGVESLQNQVSILAASLQKVSLAQADDNGSELKLLGTQIEETKALLEEAKRDIGWSKYSVQVNDLLPSYKQILASFKSEGIEISNTFGSSSQVPVRPGIFMLSFGTDVDVSDLQSLVRLLTDLGLEAIQLGNRYTPSKSIYIGGYGYHKQSVAWLTDDLRNSVLQEGISKETLIDLITSASRPVIPNMNEALATLEPQEAKAAKPHIGLEGDNYMSLEGVAQRLDLSRLQVRAILSSAVQKLDQHIDRPM